MRAKVQMTHDWGPYKKGDSFTCSEALRDELLTEDVAKELEMPEPDRSPPGKQSEEE